MVPWVVASLTLSGCSGDGASTPTAHLQGTVTIAGKPLSDQAIGGITFRPMQTSQGREVFARIVNGRYDSPNTPKGPVKVYFSISQPTGRTIRSERTGQQVPEIGNVVPEKYGGGIDLEVVGDKNDEDFDLP